MKKETEPTTTFWVVQDRNSGKWVKKYKHIYYYSEDKKKVETYLTPNLGSARIYPSEALARNSTNFDVVNKMFNTNLVVVKMNGVAYEDTGM